MPYMQDGMCVHKKNADGTAGEMVKCFDTEEEARQYYEALMANVPDANKTLYEEVEVPSTVVKALEGERIGGYLVLYGSRAAKDLTGEYFTRDTADMLNIFKAIGTLPMLYHHGANAKLGATLVGKIDTLESDDVGLWAEAELSKRNRYVQQVKDLIAKGALSFSSGTLPLGKKRDADGKITRWPIVEGSLTPTPAEPRGTDVAHLAPMKAVAAAYKALNLSTDVLGLDAQDDATEGGQKTASVHVQPGKSIPQNEEDTNMPEAIDQGVLAKAVQDELDRRAAEATAKADADAKIEAEVQRRVQEQLKTTPTKSLPAPKPEGDGRIEVLRATKYSDMSAETMSFLGDVLLGMNYLPGVKNWQPSDEFCRELAVKSFKAVEKGLLPASAVKGLMDAGVDSVAKANELSHTAQTSYGLEFVADSWRAQLWQKVRQENIIAPLFQMVDMPTDPYELPFESTDPTVYHAAETTDQTHQVYTSGNPITQTKIGSGKTQMATEKLATRLAWSSELEEDSIVPVADNYRRQTVRALQNAIDNVLINGDNDLTINTNINLIDGTPGGTEKYTAFDAIRLYCLVTNTAQKKDGAGAITLALMRNARFLLEGAYALQPKQCAWLVDDSTYGSMLAIPEFLTMDKAGAQATAMTGQIGFADGVPVLASAELSLTNATGKISATPANNTKGQAVIVFRPNWLIGYRRQINAVVEKIPGWDAYHLTASCRLCMVNFGGSTKSAAELYDLTV